MTTSEEICGTLPGGCLCQATTYTFPQPSQSLPVDFNWEPNIAVPGGKDGSNKRTMSHGYCNSCQGSAGTLVATRFTIPRKQFQLRNKGPMVMYKSSNHATSEFVSLLRS